MAFKMNKDKFTFGDGTNNAKPMNNHGGAKNTRKQVTENNDPYNMNYGSPQDMANAPYDMEGHPMKRAGLIIKGAKGLFNAGKKLFSKSKKPVVNTKKTNLPATTTKNPVSTTPKNVSTTSSTTPSITSMTPKSSMWQKAKKGVNTAMNIATVSYVGSEIVNAIKGPGKDKKNDTTTPTTTTTTNNKTSKKKDPYADAKKKDSNLPDYVKQRNSSKKGTEEYNVAQNRINKAYGVDKRHGVTESKATKGRDTVTRKRTPGIVNSAKLERKRVVGDKQIDQTTNEMTGKSKERKTKTNKSKERFYDANKSLDKKTKDKKSKSKVTTYGDDGTITKTKINKRTGKVKTKVRQKGQIFSKKVK